MSVATIPIESAVLGQRMPALVARFQLTWNLLEFYLTFGTQTESRNNDFFGKICLGEVLILWMEDVQKKFEQIR